MTVADLPELRFTGALVLTSDGLEDMPLSVADGRIASGGGPAMDLSGYMILPGIVDLHGDGFERHLAPRRGALQSHEAGLRAFDAELATTGITTAVLAQFFSWEGGMRSPDFAEALVDALLVFDATADLHLQLRLETHVMDAFPRALALIERARIGYVVFNDHIPHAALEMGKRPPRLTGQALKSGHSPDAHLKLLQSLHARRSEVPGALAELAGQLAAWGVRMGSHDDHTPADRAQFRALGADIAEFPETVAAAEAAKSAGEPVIMGAPNVVRGGSHDGKVSAREVIFAGLADVLVSDYHYPSPAQAAFVLMDKGMDITHAWGMISSAPARLMGWSDRGRIEVGQRADLVFVERATRRLRGTLCGGRFSHLSGDLAHRLIGGGVCA